MKSIIQPNKTYCYLCSSSTEALDEHHVFGGSRRKLSEKYGLTVYLCHSRCHIFGANAVHANAEVSRRLQATVQRKAMEYYGWSEDEFRQIFGKSYL